MNEQSIFAAALTKKTADERKAFLDEACGQNADLRAQVEELLAADAAAGSFLEHPPAGIDATAVATLIGADSVDNGRPAGSLPFLESCEKPDRIGKLGVYEVIEVVGQGGMGSVLRAMDTKLSRIVAVKVMAQELAANPTAVKRFLREAQSAAAVVHDHVVTIHAVDDHSQPPYLVMEFIEGQTLQQKIDREGALQLRHILRIGSQTAAGLAAAHRTGLIHRDVKPANILLENGVERVKITDFGLARAADDVEMTRTGMIAGTPQYMSPEQANGGQIDFRSDLFSLGSVLYTMCTGRPAFRAETTMGTLRRVTDDVPRPIREVNAEIPAWLDAIVSKLLAKNPGDRFQSAGEVADLLSQHLAHVQNPSHVPRPADIVLEPAGAPVTPGTESKPDGGPAARPKRKRLRAYSGLLWVPIVLTFALAVAVFGPAAKRFVFNQGTLQFTGAQGVSQARIEIDRNGQLIDVLTFPAERQIDLPSGDYQLDVTQVPPPSDALAATLMYPRTINVKQGQTWKIEISWMRAAPVNAQVTSALSAPVTEAGWTRLFNGRDLTGWKVHPTQPNKWNVEDGVLVGTGGISNLFSERGDYVDFELRLEARISENGNSGVMLRSEYAFGFDMTTIGGSGQMPRGMEVDVHPGIQPEHAGSIWHLGTPVWTEMASRQLVRPDRWFTLDILAQGNRLEVQIDGIVVLQTNRPDIAFRSGHIALLQQMSEKGEVRFRKIEIRELPPAKKERILKRFGPGDAPLDGKLVKTEGEGWRIEMPAKEAKDGAPPAKVKLFKIENLPAIGGACFVRGQIKTSGFKEEDTPAVFGDWQTASGGRSSCGTQIRPAAEWKPWSFKANKAGADGVVSVEIYLQNESPHAGTVWIKDLDVVALSIVSTVSPAAAVAPFGRTQAREHQARWAGHLGIGTEETNSLGMKFQLIPPGEFERGSSDEELNRWRETGLQQKLNQHFFNVLTSEGPQHHVVVSKPFYLGATEVTVGQFRKFVEAQGFKTNAETDGKGGAVFENGDLVNRPELNWNNPGIKQDGEMHPVTQVSWNDALAFCQWLSEKEGRTYRLPTEAEWEHACRAGTTTSFHSGDALRAQDVEDARYVGGTNPVELFVPNPFGLYGMHVNVIEWCADVWDQSTYARLPARVVDPAGPKEGTLRVQRGGAWGDLDCNKRSASRRGIDPSERHAGSGFRVVREIRSDGLGFTTFDMIRR